MKKSNALAAGLFAAMLAVSGSAFANHMDGHDGGKWEHKKGGEHCMMGEKLSPEEGKLVHEAMEKSHATNEKIGKEMYDLHVKLDAQLKAQKFDKAAFLSTYDKIAALHGKMERNRAAAFADIAGGLSPEHRMHAGMMVAGGMPHNGMHNGMHEGHGGMEAHEGMQHHAAPNGQQRDFRYND
ncbi:MAG: periplasmic heavy metal sensor [Micavibrio sp.]|nr:periplasmic heavy metal sensor [Micavibrio sp.]